MKSYQPNGKNRRHNATARLSTKGRKAWLYLMLIVSGFCFFRAMAVYADQYEVDEVYEAVQKDNTPEELGPDEYANSYVGGARSPSSIGIPDVRLSRPDEAAERRYVMFGEGEYEQVPGSEILNPASASKDRAPASAVQVPTKPTVYEPSASLLAPKRQLKALPLENPVPLREGYSHLIRQESEGRSLSSDDNQPSAAVVSAARTRGVQEVSVIATEYGYFPKRVFVTEGIPVKIFLSTPGKRASCFMVNDLGVKKGINPGALDEITFVASHPGDYRFHCPIGSIEGVLTVRPVASQQASVAVGEPIAASTRSPSRIKESATDRAVASQRAVDSQSAVPMSMPADSRESRTTR